MSDEEPTLTHREPSPGSEPVEDPAEPRTLCAAFQHMAARLSERTALRAIDGSFADITWAELAAKVEHTAGVLAALGVRRGDCVALMLSTRPDFHWFDLAALHLGARTVSVYNTAPPQFFAHVLTNSEAKVFVTEPTYAGQAEQAAGIVERVVMLDVESGSPWAWADAEAQPLDGFDFDDTWRRVQPSDLATMIYTSGTTGVSKGVQLTHANIVWAIGTYMGQMGLPFGADQLSFLPMAHIAARNMDYYGQLMSGFRITLSCGADPLDGVMAVRPSLFFSPPRMYEKLRARLTNAIATEPDTARRERFDAAMRQALERVRAGRLTATDDGEIEVLREIRSLVGLDRIAAAIVGGAVVAPDLLEFFHTIGVPLGESYGLSENSGVCTTNPPGGIRFGTIGVPIPGQQVRLADDGELLIRGPGVMAGYRNMPEATAEALDADGWLHTGDIVAQDGDGYLRIIDRKKDLIINAAGKNMSPALIEGELSKAGRLLGSAVAIGEGRPYLVALLTLDPDAVAAYCARHDIPDAPLESLARDPRILAVVDADVKAANENLSRVEQIKRFHIVTDTWIPGGDEVTNTMKIKRKGVAARYRDVIDGLYASPSLANAGT